MKKIVSMMLIFIMLISLANFSYAIVENNIKIFVNDNELVIPENLGKAFIDDHSRTQIPLRAVAEGLGHEVGWDGETWTVSIDKEITIKIGERVVNTPAGEVKMDTEAVIIDGRTYVPLRFVVEALGYTIDYKYTQGYHRIDIFSPNIESPVEEDGEVTKIDISDLKAPHYTTKSGKMSIYKKYGFDTNSIVGDRPQDSTLEDDIKHFNEGVLNGTTWKFTSYGMLGYSSLPDDARPADTVLIVSREPKTDVPIIKVRQWRKREGEESFTRILVAMNATATALQYYCKSDRDAEAIWAYLDKHFLAKENPPLDKTLQFGETKIKITDPGVYGLDIYILN